MGKMSIDPIGGDRRDFARRLSIAGCALGIKIAPSEAADSLVYRKEDNLQDPSTVSKIQKLSKLQTLKNGKSALEKLEAFAAFGSFTSLRQELRQEPKVTILRKAGNDLCLFF